MEEMWRPVSGHGDGDYEVSSQGRVRGPRGFLALTLHSSGYLMVGIRGKCPKVHRLVAEAFIGPRPDGLQTCHGNGDKTDNRIENLRYDTARANQLDKQAHGTDHQLAKVRCPHGHAYDEANTMWLTDGGKRAPYRKCRACHRERQRAYKARLRSAA